jgi:hypothetical protein
VVTPIRAQRVTAVATAMAATPSSRPMAPMRVGGRRLHRHAPASMPRAAARPWRIRSRNGPMRTDWLMTVTSTDSTATPALRRHPNTLPRNMSIAVGVLPPGIGGREVHPHVAEVGGAQHASDTAWHATSPSEVASTPRLGRRRHASQPIGGWSLENGGRRNRNRPGSRTRVLSLRGLRRPAAPGRAS